MKIANYREKARAVCDGSTRGGQSQIHGPTYAPTTPDITDDLRLFFAFGALENKLIYGADVSNAFAEAGAAPVQQYFMRAGVQFRDWWASKGRSPFHQILSFPLFSRISKVTVKPLVNGLVTLIISFKLTNLFLLSLLLGKRSLWTKYNLQ